MQRWRQTEAHFEGWDAVQTLIMSLQTLKEHRQKIRTCCFLHCVVFLDIGLRAVKLKIKMLNALPCLNICLCSVFGFAFLPSHFIPGLQVLFGKLCQISYLGSPSLRSSGFTETAKGKWVFMSHVVDDSRSLPAPLCLCFCGRPVMTVMGALVMNGSPLHLQHLPPSSLRDNSEQGGYHCSHAAIDEIVSQPVETAGGK